MAEELKVYLDHHIERDNFLYKRSNYNMSRKELDSSQPPQILRLKDLYGENSMDLALRKPDFQRATWAWTPEECVSLLESVVNEQIIPSLIMWLSPEDHWYVLDGGHRISVVLAWLRDDWGNKSTDLYKGDEDIEHRIKEAANTVQSIMGKQGIEKFSNYRSAYERIESLSKEDRESQAEIDTIDSKKARFYRKVVTGSIVFPLQWVRGDYEKAEKSFLKINSSGRCLTEWERKIVENRNSSFARVVISIASITSAEHCWPLKASKDMNRSNTEVNVKEILAEVERLHKIFYESAQDLSFKRQRQPLFAEPKTEPDKKPAYLAELLTIIKGGKGQKSQLDRLLLQDQHSLPEQIIDNGLKLIRETKDTLNHIVGISSQSLSIVPSLYFYSENGKYVRGLFYGFIYWLFSKNDEVSTMNKKLLFTVHRYAFEQVIITKKKEIVSNFDRKIGSGAEITVQVSEYYDKLLKLLIDFNDDIRSEAFVEEYESTFPQKANMSKKNLEKLPYNQLPKCTICSGLLDVEATKMYAEFLEDKNVAVSESAHSFCEANRQTIANIASGKTIIDLNAPSINKEQKMVQQLTFLEFELHQS